MTFKDDERQREFKRAAESIRAEKKLRRQSQSRQRKARQERARIDRHARRLSDAELKKKEQFGERAKARTPKDALLLARITGEITREREARALSQFRPKERVAHWINVALGFSPSVEAMTAAHKGQRAHAAYMMSRKFRRFFRRNKHRYNFYFVTLIHDGWRTLDRSTTLDLKDIKTRVRNVFHQHKRKHHALNYVGVIELDSVLNYPQGGQGICIMPHVHMIVWCDRSVKKSDLEAELGKTTRLVSEWDAPTVDVGERHTDEDIVHTAYYMLEQPFKAKKLVIHPKTRQHSLRTVQSRVPPHLTLRLSEMLAHCTLKELIIAGGKGIRLKGKLMNALKKYPRSAGSKKRSGHLTAAQAFASLRATGTRGFQRGPVTILR